jgi:translocation and assembly module TamB
MVAGQLQALAQGTSGVPFRIAANAALTPTLDPRQSAGQRQPRAVPPGAARRHPPGRADWVLEPATLVLPQGNVRLAGRYGRGLEIQSRFERARPVAVQRLSHRA